MTTYSAFDVYPDGHEILLAERLTLEEVLAAHWPNGWAVVYRQEQAR